MIFSYTFPLGILYSFFSTSNSRRISRTARPLIVNLRNNAQRVAIYFYSYFEKDLASLSSTSFRFLLRIRRFSGLNQEHEVENKLKRASNYSRCGYEYGAVERIKI